MAHIERTRAVVEADERYDGRIFPAERAEIDRPVRINEGSTVEGSVYGSTVEVAGDALVEGSIMAAESVEIDGGRVAGEIGTPGRAVASESRITGTVTGKRVRLTDCVVRGNVVGSDVILENCVVLGIATADRDLTIEDTLCYTFRNRGETTVDGATTVLPQAIADGSITFETPIAVAGLGTLDLPTDGGLPEMDADDTYEREGTTYVTLAPRILNLEKVTERLEELERGIMDVVDDTSDDADDRLGVEAVLELLDVDVEVSV
ncbi:MAG: hypothetical protein ACQET5_02800 [Halobacteriota archaeon]|uniref:hypothetical protein n=1 Tax=Natronomonas sp. TaxID=2184060 RepID=UPI003976B018